MKTKKRNDHPAKKHGTLKRSAAKVMALLLAFAFMFAQPAADFFSVYAAEETTYVEEGDDSAYAEETTESIDVPEETTEPASETETTESYEDGENAEPYETEDTAPENSEEEETFDRDAVDSLVINEANYILNEEAEAVDVQGEAAENKEKAAAYLEEATELNQKRAKAVAKDLFAAPSLRANNDYGPENIPGYERQGDGSNIESIAAKWITEDTVDNGDDSLLYVRPMKDELQSVRLQINYALSGEHNYNPYDITIVVPSYIFKDRNGNDYGTMIIPFPEDPSTKGDFNWKLIDGNYVLTNTRPMSAATKGYIQFAFDEMVPHELVDMAVSSDFSADIYIVTHRGNTLGLRSNSLNAQFDTEARVTNVAKRVSVAPHIVPASSIPAAQRIEGEEEYLKIDWYVWGVTKSNTMYTLDGTDSIPQDAIVLGDQTEADFHGFILNGTAEDGTVYERNGLYHGYRDGQGSYYYFATAYPASQFEADTLYTFHNDIEYRVTEDDPEAEVTNPNVQAVDPQLVTTTKASAKTTWQYTEPTWENPPGHFMVTKNGNDDTERNNLTHKPQYPNGRSDLHLWYFRPTDFDGWYGIYPSGMNDLRDEYAENGEEGKIRLGYTIDSIGYVMPWMFDETSFIKDGAVASRLSRNYNRPVSITTTDTGVRIGRYGEILTVGKDYEFISVEFPEAPYVYSGVPQNINPDGSWAAMYSEDGTFEYTRDNRKANWPDITLQIQRNGEWEDYAVASWKSGSFRLTLVEDGYVQTAHEIALPEGTENFRTMVTLQNTSTNEQANQCLQAAIDYDVRIVIELKSTESLIGQIEDLFELSNLPEMFIYNGVNMVAHDSNGEQLVELNKDGYDRVRGYTTDTMVYPYKTAVQGIADTDYENHNVIIHYNARVEERSLINDKVTYEQAIADGRLQAETRGVWRDLLPKGVTPLIDTIRVRDGDEITYVGTEENYDGSGRTLLTVKANLTPVPERYQNGGVYYYQDVPSISFDAVYSFDALADYGDNVHNVIAFESSNDYIGTIENYSGEPDDPDGGGNVSSPRAFENDEEKEHMTDLDKDRDTPSFVYAGTNTKIDLISEASTSLTKEIMVNNDGWWSTGVWREREGEEYADYNRRQMEENERVVYEGGWYSYRLRMSSNLTTRSKDLILYDSLEDFKAKDGNSDIDIDAASWQGTFLSVDVSQLESAGIAPVVYYATQNLQLAIEDGSQQGIRNPDTMDITLSDIWTEANEFIANGGDVSTVKAIAVDASKKADGSDFILEPLESIVVIVNMQAPSGEDARRYISQSGKWGRSAYAYNNIFLTCESINTETGESDNENFIRKDYTKVGLMEYSYEVTKTWDDDDDRDALRPDHVTIHLIGDEEDTGLSQVLPLEKPESPEDTTSFADYTAAEWAAVTEEEWKASPDAWTASFKNIPYTDPYGKKIVYFATEDPVEGYKPSVVLNGLTSEEIKNVHVPEKISIPVTKTWSFDREELRPESIGLKLYAKAGDSSVLLKTVTVQPDVNGNWKYTFEDLFKYDQGNEIEYKVVETVTTKKGQAYELGEPTWNEESGELEIVNTYHPYGDLLVTKTTENTTAVSKEKLFTFTFNFTKEEVDEEGNTEEIPVFDEYDYIIYDEEGNPLDAEGNVMGEDGVTGQISNNGTLQIKGGQSIYVKEIDEDVHYQVSEEKVAGFTLTESEGAKGTIVPNETQTASFVNTYEAKESINLEAEKTLMNRKLNRFQFQFNLYELTTDETGATVERLLSRTSNDAPTEVVPRTDEEGNEIEGTVEYSVAPVKFNAIRYTQEDANIQAETGKPYVYRVEEVLLDKAGYTYDTSEYLVYVTVVDNGDGTLTVEKHYQEPAYNYTDYPETLPVNPNNRQIRLVTDPSEIDTSVITEGMGTGMIWNADSYAAGRSLYEAFIKHAAEVGTPQYASYVSPYDQTEYNYITRIEFEGYDTTLNSLYRAYADSYTGGWTNNNRKEPAQYESYENGIGKLVMEFSNPQTRGPAGEYITISTFTIYPAIRDGWQETEVASFKNSYEANGKITLRAWKDLKGRRIDEGEFTFELLDADSKVIQTKTNSADGSIVFDPISFDQTAIGKTFYFFVREKADTDNTVDYDDSVFGYDVTVVDNGDGSLSFRQGNQTVEADVDYDAIGSIDEIKLNVRYSSGYIRTYREYSWTELYDQYRQELRSIRVYDQSHNPNPRRWYRAGGTFEDRWFEAWKAYQTPEAEAFFDAIIAEGLPQSTSIYIPQNTYTQNCDMDVETLKSKCGVSEVAAGDVFIHYTDAETSIWVGGTADDNDTYITYMYIYKLIPALKYEIVGETPDLPVFVNTLKPGALSVTKHVTDAEDADPNQEFKFKVKLIGEGIEDGTMEYELSQVGRSSTSAAGGRSVAAALPGRLQAPHDAKMPASKAPVLRAPEDGAIITESGESGTVTWEFYSDGTLLLRPTSGDEGTMESLPLGYDSGHNSPWGRRYLNSRILSVETQGTIHLGECANYLFFDLSNCTSMDLSGIDASTTTNLGHAFRNCAKLTSLDLSGWDTSNVTDLSFLFAYCDNLESVDLSGKFDTSSATTLYRMFIYDKSLVEADLSNFDTSNVTDMREMFNAGNRGTSLKTVDISSFDMITGNTDVSLMFGGCKELSTLKVGEKTKFTSDIWSGVNPPTNNVYTGRWVRDDQQAGPYTAADFWNEYDGASMAGTWVWEKVAHEYTIHFLPAEGASGAMPNETCPVDEEYVLPTNLFARFGYTFDHWVVTDENGMPLTPEKTYENKGTIPAGTFGSDEQVYLKAVLVPRDTSVNIQDGEFEFTLRGDEKATFNDLPAGTSYQVWEDSTDGWVLIEQRNTSGEIVPLETAEASFTNRYQPGVTTAQFSGTKMLDTLAAEKDAYIFLLTEPENETGTITILGEEGEEEVALPLEVKTLDGGFVQFPVILYDEPGTHYYQITEVDPEDPAVDYDTHTEGVTVVVTKDREDKLSSEVTYDSDGIRFVNKTRPGQLEITKIGDGITDANKDDEFTFEVTLYNEKGMPLGEGDEIYWYKTDGDGNIVGKSNSIEDSGASVLISDRTMVGSAAAATVGINEDGSSSVVVDSRTLVGSDLSGYPEAGATVSYSGTQGTVTWELYSDGTLVLRPTSGEEGTFTSLGRSSYREYNIYTAVPWYQYRSDIIRVKTEGTIHLQGSCAFLFYRCTNLTDLDIDGLEFSEAEYIGAMFAYCPLLTSLDLSSWDTHNVKNVCTGYSAWADSYGMFEGCSGLTDINLSGWDMTQVTTLYAMFKGCSSLMTIDLDSWGWETPNVSRFDSMFEGCRSLETLKISDLNVSSGTHFSSMFENCTKLRELDLSNWDAPSTTAMIRTFKGMSVLEKLDLSGFNTSEVYSFYCMFKEGSASTPNLRSITLGPGFSFVGSVTGGTQYLCLFPTPSSSSPYTGKWIRADEQYGPYTPEELRDNYESYMADEWVWEVRSDKGIVTFDANGGYTSAERIIATSAEQEITMPGDRTSRLHYILTGWNTEADGSGTSYDPNETATDVVEMGGTVTLYAQWEATNLREYQVKHYQQNAAMDDYVLAETERFMADKDTDVTPETKEYPGFTAPQTQTATVLDDDSLVIEYYYDRITYDIQFDGNGAISGQMDEPLHMVGGIVKNLPSNQYEKEDALFIGWNTKADGSGERYADRHPMNLDVENGAVVTLYAQWLENPSHASPTNGVITVSCKAGETIVIPDLPAGTKYTIRETDPPNGWTQSGQVNEDGTITANETSSASVTNKYTAEGVIPLVAHKKLEGRDPDDGQFTFELLDSERNVLQSVTNGALDTEELAEDEEGNLVDNPWTGTAIVNFDALKYTQDDIGKTFTYYIREVRKDSNEVIFDEHEETVTVTVEDAGGGVLSVTAEYDEDGPLFTNTLQPATLIISKETIGATEDVGNDQFSFTVELTNAEGEPLNGAFPATKHKRDQSEESMRVSSGDTIKLMGGESLEIREVPDGTEYKVEELELPKNWTLTTTDNAEGTLQAGAESEAVFKNTYEDVPYRANGGVSFEAKKTVEGGIIEEEDDFAFQLLDAEGNVMQGKSPDTLSSDTDEVSESSVTFDPISFTEEDAGKTFTYYIQEVTGSDPNVTYDKHIYKVTVTVTDKEDGTLEVEKTYTTTEGGEEVEKEVAEFTNVKTGQLKLKKTDEDTGAGLQGAEFTIINEERQFLGADGSLSEEEVTVASDADGIVALTNIPAGNYTVKETKLPKAERGGYYRDPATLTFSVENGEASVDEQVILPNKEAVITNKQYTSVSVEKQWDDDDDRDRIRPTSIQVQLFADDAECGDPVTIEADEDGNWSYSWSDLPKYEEGELINYTVTEETVIEGYDEPVIKGDAVSGYTITNSYTPETTSVPGTKTWDDAENQDGKRPESITVTLLANGEPVLDEEGNQVAIVVTEKDEWSYEFTDLPKNEAGEEITYTVLEEALTVDGYSADYDGYNIINTYKPEERDISVRKVWDDVNDKDKKRPASVEVTLLADGKTADVEDAVITLDDKNEWAYTWKDLPKYKAGKVIEYTVEEKKVPDYTTTITGEASTGFVITNKHVPPEEVKTGDHSKALLYLVLMLAGVSAAATLLLVRMRKKQKESGR